METYPFVMQESGSLDKGLPETDDHRNKDVLPTTDKPPAEGKHTKDDQLQHTKDDQIQAATTAINKLAPKKVLPNCKIQFLTPALLQLLYIYSFLSFSSQSSFLNTVQPLVSRL
jgi:hypothetical protein